MKDWIGKYCLINGNIQPVDSILKYLSFSEKSVYEVLRVEQGVPLFVEDHFFRLENSFLLCGKKLKIALPEFKGAVTKLVDKNGITEGPVKFVFNTANAGTDFVAYFMIPHRPSPEEYRSGIKTVTLCESRNNPNAKIWNMHLRETAAGLISKNEAYEAILIDNDGYVTEGSRSNIFFVKGDTVFTPPDEFVLPGITRKKVIELCRLNGIEIILKRIPLKQLGTFDSSFLTGTSRKIVPVKYIDDLFFDTNNKLVRKIMRYFDDLVNSYILKHKKL